ncbi:MAG TPA: hypothetical protein PLB38_00725 [bacterium]|nr:hypothetical protein [bacterium]
MKNNITDLALLDVNTLTRNFKFDTVETEIYQNIGKTFKGYIGNDVTPDKIFLGHEDVVKGIQNTMKLDVAKVENVLVKMTTGKNPLINIRRHPVNNTRIVTPTKYFWQNYDNNK